MTTRSTPAPPRAAKPPVPPVKPKRAQSSLLPWMIGGAALCVLAAFAAGALMLLILALSNNRIPDDTFVLGVDISGLSRADAEEALAAVNPPVTFSDGERTFEQPFSALGVALDAEQTIANDDYTPALTVDFGAAQTALVALSDAVNVPATVDAPGRALDVPVLLARLQADAGGELADLHMDLPMFETERLTPAEAVRASYSGPMSTHVVDSGEELGLIAKRYNVSVADIAALNGIDDPNFIYPGQELTIPASGEYVPTAADAPPAPLASGRSILVSVTDQRIYAYENGTLVHSYLVSTGLPATPTVLGDYNIYVKYTADDMSGPDYFLPAVPYTMYFYQGYAIHGTYWHSNFGRPMSHGCVNLPVDEAAWFFDFASVGTLVRVVA